MHTHTHTMYTRMAVCTSHRCMRVCHEVHARARAPGPLLFLRLGAEPLGPAEPCGRDAGGGRPRAGGIRRGPYQGPRFEAFMAECSTALCLMHCRRRSVGHLFSQRPKSFNGIIARRRAVPRVCLEMSGLHGRPGSGDGRSTWRRSRRSTTASCGTTSTWGQRVEQRGQRWWVVGGSQSSGSQK